MKFEIQKITQPLDLGEYDEQYRGNILNVWVNPPREVRQVRVKLMREFDGLIRQIVSTATTLPPKKWNISESLAWIGRMALPPKHESDVTAWQRRNYAWLAQMLGDDYTAFDLERLVEADEVLYQWILKRTVEMIESFQAEKKSPSKILSTT